MTIESPQSHLTGNISMTYASFLFLRGYQAVTKENSSRNKKDPGHAPTMAGCIVKGERYDSAFSSFTNLPSKPALALCQSLELGAPYN